MKKIKCWIFKHKMNQIELQRCQSELYGCVITRNPDFHLMFEKYQNILDKDIIVYTGSLCACGTDFESILLKTQDHKLFTLDEMSRNIRVGQCSCASEFPSHKKEKKSSVRLVHVVAACENIDMLKSLIELGCSVNVYTNLLNMTPLFLSVYRNKKELIDLLITYNADVNCRCLLDKVSALSQAISHRRVNIVRKLLEVKDIDVNIRNQMDETPVILSLRLDCKEILEMLLEAGADVNCKDARGNSLTMLASVKGAEYLRPVLAKKPLINCRTERNETALFFAAYVESDEAVKLLLEHGADPNLVNSEGMSVLNIAMASCQTATNIVELLLQYNADINITNNQGYGAVHIAAWNRLTYILKLFLRYKGVKHDQQTGDKNTPLSLAAHGGHVEAIDLLLPLGCDINNADKDRDTPLHYAAYNGMTDTVKKLLQWGANPELVNNYNTTPLWNAVCMKHKDVVKLLLDENVKMEVASVGIHQHMHSNEPITVYPIPRSPLYVAAHKKSHEILCLLILAGYNLYKEEWIYQRDYPFPAEENKSLVNLLETFSEKPQSLISTCRNYLRTHFGRKVHSIVEKLEIPRDLKDYLLLKDLIYVPMSR